MPVNRPAVHTGVHVVMENALYYAFSAIVQSLAAAIAILTAFALYRLQRIDTALRDAGFILMQNHLQNVDMWNLYVQGEYGQFRERFIELRKERDGESWEANLAAGAEGYAKFRQIDTDWRTRTNLLPHFKDVLILTGEVIALSLAVLCFVPAILRSACAPVLVLITGAMFFVVCLVKYYFFIMRILDSR
jgi:hypothetical protein